MKISVIHNLYKRNPYVNESIQYNLHALKEANVDYQYILFNYFILRYTTLNYVKFHIIIDLTLKYVRFHIKYAKVC